MYRSLKGLIHSTIHATDGDIGKAVDLLFDDVSWIIRYVVVDTGKWLPGRRVLLSPASIVRSDWPSSRLHLNLTQTQIKESPPVESDQPVSRQQEDRLVEYFAWPVYWGPAGMGSLTGAGAVAARADDETSPRGDPNLRSVNEVTGYHVHALDGRIGHVEDMIVDDDSWDIRFVVVDTRNWIPGKKVLVAPHWFTDVRWKEQEVDVSLERETIKDGPEYATGTPISREMETRIYDHYKRPYNR